jgi:hypothetical protein
MRAPRRNTRGSGDRLNDLRRTRRLFVERLERRDYLAADAAALGLYTATESSAPIAVTDSSDAIETQAAAARGGNVTVAVIDGLLVIRGDEANNKIVIEQTGDDSFYVEGLNGYSTINGQSAWQASPISNCMSGWTDLQSGVKRGIDIEMGDGDNTVWLSGTSLPSVKITLGNGTNSVELSGISRVLAMGQVRPGINLIRRELMVIWPFMPEPAPIELVRSRMSAAMSRFNPATEITGCYEECVPAARFKSIWARTKSTKVRHCLHRLRGRIRCR